jgi:nucleoside-diphosphate-sugar epimerase
MSKYIVTGVAGFIGSRVAEFLLAGGHSVIGLDNMNDAYDVRMKEHRLQSLLSQPGFNFIRMDIADRQAISTEDRLQGGDFSAVINLAARAGVRKSLEDPWLYMDTNLTGTLNLLELCRQEGIPKFILASTSSIYGADAPYPTAEDAGSDLPLQPYAASKKAAEVLCHSYHYLYGIDVTVVRYFTVYGPAGRPDMSLFRFTKWITEGKPVTLFGDGEQTRGFTYIDDIARGTIAALTPVGYQIINLGGHENIRIIALIRMLENLIGHEALIIRKPAHPADMLASWANVEKAKQLLSWEPKVNMQEGLTNLVEWYDTERAWASTINTGL